MNWIRVSKDEPCPICKRRDWCTICPELNLAHCMRVTSGRPSKNSMGGYLHALDGRPVAVAKREPKPVRTIDASGMMKRWFASTTPEQYEELAESLEVSPAALISIKCAYATEYNAWAFPMRNGAGAVVGIRLRAASGRKWAVAGGHEGIFISTTKPCPTAFLPEGPTSLAAMLSLGKYAIGRPSCSGGIAQIAATLARLGIYRAVILADNDDDKLRPNGDRFNPGLDGGKRLSEEIGVPCCVLVLPCKDAREFIQMGGTSEVLDSLTHSLVWHQPKKRSHFTHAANMTVPIPA